MGWVDQIPRAGRLFIGGLHPLYNQPSLFKQAGITHILSVLDFDTNDLSDYTHLHISVEDQPDENLLQHFNETNRFIDNALNNGGGVYVVCLNALILLVDERQLMYEP